MKEKGSTICNYFHLSSKLVLVLSSLLAFETEFSILHHYSILAPHSLCGTHHNSIVNNFLTLIFYREVNVSRSFLSYILKNFSLFQWFQWPLKFWQFELCSLPDLDRHPLCLMWAWPLRSAPLDHRGNEFGKASYKFSSRLGGFCWSLGYGDTISSSSRWFTVTWSCSNQLMIRDKLITHFPNKMYSTYQHKQWTSNKLNSFAVRDRTLINKIWLQVSNSAPRQNCN